MKFNKYDLENIYNCIKNYKMPYEKKTVFKKVKNGNVLILILFFILSCKQIKFFHNKLLYNFIFFFNFYLFNVSLY